MRKTVTNKGGFCPKLCEKRGCSDMESWGDGDPPANVDDNDEMPATFNIAGGSRLPLRFHQICGENVVLKSSNKTAKRNDSFCKALCFSNRPIEIDEIVCIKFVCVATNWSGVLRFGVTNNNPADLASAMPKYACPDLTNRPGNWAKALPERYCQQGSILHFWVTATGSLFYGIDGQNKGVFLTGIQVDKPLYVLIDIYGNTQELEFIDQDDLKLVCQQLRSNSHRIAFGSGTARQQSLPSGLSVAGMMSSLSLSDSTPSSSLPAPVPEARCNNPFAAPPPTPARPAPVAPAALNVSSNNQRRISSPLAGDCGTTSQFNNNNVSFSSIQPPVTAQNTALIPLPVKYHAGIQFLAMKFHAFKGRGVVLLNDSSYAIRNQSMQRNCYVFTSRQVKAMEKLVLQVIALPASGGPMEMAFGLTTCDPTTLLVDKVVLPDDANQLLDRPEYWLVKKEVSPNARVGDELSFYFDTEGVVYYQKNNSQPSVIMHLDATQKFWMFFDLCGNSEKVRLLGTIVLPEIPTGGGSSASPTCSGIAVAGSASPGRPAARGGQAAAAATCSSTNAAGASALASNTSSNFRFASPPVSGAVAATGGGNASSGNYGRNGECTICFENPIKIVLVPCGHGCMCSGCAVAMQARKAIDQLCPICRKAIQLYQPLFLS